MSKLLEQINNTKETKRLGDLVLINQSTINGNFPYKEIEYIDTASVTKNHFEKPQILNTVEAPSRAKRLLRDGDTILSTVRPNLRHYGFIKNPKPNTVVSTGFVVLTPKSIDPFYLYSYLTQDSITDTLSSIAEATTTTFPAFRPEVLSEMEIEIPNLPTQKKIAEILSTYDAKIENNNKIIKNLEATAQVIFNEWFINFCLPAEVLTKAGFPNGKIKMVDNEMRKIPEGWGLKTFKDSKIFSNCKDRIGKFEGQKLYFDTSCIDGIEIVKDPLVVSQDNIPSRAQFIPVYNSVWFARMSNTYKVLVFDKFSDFEVNNYLLSSGMLGIKTEEKYLGFLFAVIKSKVFHIQKDSGATGSTQVSLTDDGFSSIRILFPSLNLIEKYSDIVNRYISHIINLQKENMKLKESRDQLLAKLI